ncbi:MAG: TetR/AcrR family transcriptional regulator [Treponema sp.]|nr:TetR/AcrR family transcriptional regulator [Treponema sp.]
MRSYSIKRTEQKEIRRQEILAAGLNLFIRKGYAATKTADISKAAGISEGLLFHYFETKEKLYEELIRIGVSSPQNLLSGINAEPLEYFRTAAREIFHYIETMPFVAQMFILMKQASCNEAAPEPVKKLLADFDSIAISVKKIRQGQKNGTIREGNPHALAIAFWGAVQGIAEQTAIFPVKNIPDSEWITDILKRRN